MIEQQAAHGHGRSYAIDPATLADPVQPGDAAIPDRAIGPGSKRLPWRIAGESWIQAQHHVMASRRRVEALQSGQRTDPHLSGMGQQRHHLSPWRALIVATGGIAPDLARSQV